MPAREMGSPLEVICGWVYSFDEGKKSVVLTTAEQFVWVGE